MVSEGEWDQPGFYAFAASSLQLGARWGEGRERLVPWEGAPRGLEWFNIFMRACERASLSAFARE